MDKAYAAVPGVLTREVGGEMLLLNSDTELYFALNTSGAAMYELLIDGRSTEEVVAEKMSEFGVRYIVWLDGFTETTDRSGSISCTVGPGGAGCFGFGSWEDDANFDARVWDVGSLTNVGTISTDATGQSYLPALVIPIPLIARVEANACSRLAAQLQEFVNGS